MVSLLIPPFLVVPDSQGNPLAEFSFYPADELLYVRWHGHLTAKEVIHVSSAGSELCAALPHRRLLNDKSQTTGDWHEALPWLHYEWLPQAAGQGLCALGYVVSADVLQQLVSQQFVAEVSSLLAVKVFYDQEKARQWLLTK